MVIWYIGLVPEKLGITGTDFASLYKFAKNPSKKLLDQSLRLVPHPSEWMPSAGVCNLSQPLNLFFEDS